MTAKMSGRVLSGLAAVAIAVGLNGFGVSVAEAGTYRAAGCEAEIGAFTPETASFAQSSGPRANWAGAGCSDSGRPYLFVGASDSVWLASAGDHAEWTISAPTGLRFRGGWFQGSPTLTSGVRSEYRYRVEGQAEPAPALRITGPGWYRWPLTDAGDVAIDQLLVRSYCAESRCYYDSSRGGPAPGLNVRYLGFEVEDYAQPVVGGLSGAIVEGAAQRATQLLAVPATDAGSGIAEVEVRVNGKRYASQDPGCKLAPDGRALRLAPCPTSPTVQLPIDTTSAPFSEGKNAVEVCVSDYAQRSNDPSSLAGEACTPTGVYVDNSCDVSQAPDAADLRFAFGKRKERMTVRYGKRARAVAKLTDAADEPIEGATVCVSSKDRIGGANEVDVAEVETNKRGKAKVKLPKGASRRVKLTYWADQERVENETLRLNVRARPKLRVLSKGKLSDGGKVRFRAKLAGPYRKHRKVAVQALAPAGWLDFPGCVGRTNRKGIFSCTYRFREQSGGVKYQFRALVPRQSGYPYLQGHTRSKKLVVRD